MESVNDPANARMTTGSGNQVEGVPFNEVLTGPCEPNLRLYIS